MKVLVTGGSGVVGRAAVNALLAAGHDVRLLARHAEDAARDWDERVEGVPGDVGQSGGVDGAAQGCDAVLHVAGIVAEEPPEHTFERVNVQGTRDVLREAGRAGAGRFVLVSSLGAERGESDYHRSKLAAERIVAEFGGSWTIVRAANVYGPGDEVISTLLRWVRSHPVIPVVHQDDRPFQPIWHEDLGRALAGALVRGDLDRRILEVAGPDTVTLHELVDRLGDVTGRHPVRLPLPEIAARIGAHLLGSRSPFSGDQLTMLAEGSVIDTPEANALERVLGVRPTTLAEGLTRLADEQREQTADEGVGALRRRTFEVRVEGCALSADELARRFREDFNRFVPIEAAAEPGSSSRLELGTSLTLNLPGRGHAQVRVEEVGPRHVLLATVVGHPLAGAVAFTFADAERGVLFTVDEMSRPHGTVDEIAMTLGGSALQGATWRQVCDRVVDESGGAAPDGVIERDLVPDEAEAERLERSVDAAIRTRRRAQENAGRRSRQPS